MISDVIQIIEIVSAFQFLFLGIFLFTNKKGFVTSNRLLSLFLLGKGLTLGFNYSLQNYFAEINSSFPIVFVLYFPLLFFYAPFLYLYAKSITDNEFSINKKLLFHLIPSGMLLIWGIIISQQGSVFRNGFIVFIDYAYYVQTITYTVLALILISKFRENLKEQFSSLEKLKFNWLIFLFSGFLFIWAVLLSISLLQAFNNDRVLIDILLSLSLFLLFIFANSIAYICLNYPFLFLHNNLFTEKKNNNLPKAVNDDSAERLKELMHSEKPYLNPDVTLNDLAEKLDLHPRTLSLIIKHSFNQNFFDFINSYRIEEAKLKLKNNGNRTILEILLDSGFNSKSAFNNFFKKSTGLTPTQYKKTLTSQ